MYSTCLFCNGSLGSNEVVEHFPVGRRLAFDAWKGRLWVVCPHCRRWNLTPLEERFEAVEECERLFRETVTRISTDEIGLAVLKSGLELVRIGKPLRPEFASWRYAGNFSLRRNRGHFVTGAGLAVAGVGVAGTGGAVMLALSVIPVTAGPGIYPAIAAIPAIGALIARDYFRYDRVVARIKHLGNVVTIRARHAGGAEMDLRAERPTLSVAHDGGRVTLEGTAAVHATGVILANSNHRGGTKAVVQSAVAQLEAVGNVEAFLAATAARSGKRRGRMLTTLSGYRGLGAMNLSLTERLALEMAVNEDTERRAMEGELAVLEEAWRDAEAIAHIADGILTPFRR